jgi:hypothetical protein
MADLQVRTLGLNISAVSQDHHHLRKGRNAKQKEKKTQTTLGNDPRKHKKTDSHRRSRIFFFRWKTVFEVETFFFVVISGEFFFVCPLIH